MLRYTIEIHKYYGTLPFVSGMYVPIDIPMHIDIYLPAIQSKGPIIYIYLNMLKTGIASYVIVQ